MSELAEFEGTSLPRQVEFVRPEATIRYGGIMDEQGTTSGLVWTMFVVGATAAAPRAPSVTVKSGDLKPSSTAEALTELRSLTGFTWQQVARVLNVTQRTPFLWFQGKPINNANEERLRRLIALICRVDRGSPDATRAALLGARTDGVVPFDLLAQGDFERTEALLGVRPASLAVSREELQVRLPSSPVDQLLLSDAKVHVEPGVARTARSVRVKKGD